MAISDTGITSVELVNTFEQWRTKTNQLITVLNENSDSNPVTNLVSANSTGGFSVNTITSNIVTGSNVTGSRLLFSGGTIDFTGANVTDLGTATKFALVEDSGATVTGSSPDSKIVRAQINECEINLNGKNINANGSSTINLSGATVTDLGTVSVVTLNGGTINDANVNITDDSGGRIITISATGPHNLTGAKFTGAEFRGPTQNGGVIFSANVTVNTSSYINSNTGAIFGSDVGTANTGIGHFPEWTGSALGHPTSSVGRLHIRTEFAAASDNKTAVDAFADELVLENGNTDVGMTLLSNTASNGVIAFGDTADTDAGFVLYDHTNDRMMLGVGSANGLMVDSEFGSSVQIPGADTLGTQSAKLHVNVGSSDGATGIFLDSNDADQMAISIDGEQTTANVIDLDVDTITSGHALAIHHGLGTGTSYNMSSSLIDLVDNNSSTTARSIINLNQDATGATSSIAFKYKIDGGQGIVGINNTTDKAGFNLHSTVAHTVPLAVLMSNSATTTGSTLKLFNRSTTGGTTTLQVSNTTADTFVAYVNGSAKFFGEQVFSGTVNCRLPVRDVGGTIVNTS